MSNAELLLRVLQVIFAAIALFNIGVGCLLTIAKILKSFGSKATVWMYLYIIVTSLGIVALKILIERS